MKKRSVLEQPRHEVPMVIGGGGKGTRGNLPVLIHHSRDSTRFAISITIADPVPGRALVLAKLAQEGGLRAQGFEQRIEDLVGIEDEALLILAMDKAIDVARVLKKTAATKRVTIGYLLVRLPSGLCALRFIVRPGENEERTALIDLFERIGTITASRGSSAIFGERGASEDIAREEIYRAWFSAHLAENLSHVVAGTAPDAYPIEFTDDGVNAMPMFVRVADSWGNPAQIAHEFTADPSLPIMRGESLIIAEIASGEGGPGLRFHKVTLRATDGCVAIQGGMRIDPATLAKLDAQERERQLQVAIERAQRETLSRMAPVLTTD